MGSKHLAAAIRILHPDADPLTDYEVADLSDGRGPELVAWRFPAPRPTPSQLESAILLAAREERKNAFRSQLDAEYAASDGFAALSVLDPTHPRVQRAKTLYAEMKATHGRIDAATTLDAVLAFKTAGEIARGK